MYMMEKLDAYQQEIKAKRALSDWYKSRNMRVEDDEWYQTLMMRYATEMFRIHDDVKAYCVALVGKAQQHNSSLDRLIFELRKANEDYAKLDKKYKALKKKITPVKKPAAKKAPAKKAATPKGT
jgi:DNA repair ATPase RecN